MRLAKLSQSSKAHQGRGVHAPYRLHVDNDNPSLRLPASYSESDLRAVDWPSYVLDDWDYVLVRLRPGALPPDVPPRLALVEHRGGWWLYATGAPK